MTVRPFPTGMGAPLFDISAECGIFASVMSVAIDSIPNIVVFSMDEVYYSLPSREYVETIEPVEAYGIRTAQLMELVESNLELCNWWRVIHQNEYRRLHQSHKERLTLDAANRYREFSQQFPEVCRRARLTDIASYLGISPATLSRIRGRIF